MIDRVGSPGSNAARTALVAATSAAALAEAALKASSGDIASGSPSDDGVTVSLSSVAQAGLAVPGQYPADLRAALAQAAMAQATLPGATGARSVGGPGADQPTDAILAIRPTPPRTEGEEFSGLPGTYVRWLALAVMAGAVIVLLLKWG